MTSHYPDPRTIDLSAMLTAKLTHVNAANPRKAGTRGHAFWSRYALGVSIGDLITAAHTDHVTDAAGHIRWDLSRGAIHVDEYDAAVGEYVPATVTSTGLPETANEDVHSAITGGSKVERATEIATARRGQRQTAA